MKKLTSIETANDVILNLSYIFLSITGKPIGEAVLYFGCRKSSEDYIYEEELNNFLEDGTLTHVSSVVKMFFTEKGHR